MLEQSYDVGERLMERGGVDTRRLTEVFAKPVNQRVGRFVGDNVMGKAREHDLAWQITARIDLRGPEVSEYQRAEARIIERVGLLDSVRKNP